MQEMRFFRVFWRDFQTREIMVDFMGTEVII